MILRIMQLALSSAFEPHRSFQVRGLHVSRRSRDRARTRLRPEGLEDRCLLSYVSSITEFPLPSGGSLPQTVGAITTGPDGNIWFSDPGANAIATINPTTHAISLFTIPNAGAFPNGLTTGPDGNMWFGERSAEAIGMINPTTHAISSFALPAGSKGPNNITSGPNGNLWFTLSVEDHQIGEINPTTHAISVFTLSPCCYAGPYDITAGPDGNMWFTGGPTGLGKINPTTDAITYFTGVAPTGITAGPDGNVWFAGSGSTVGMINPTTDAISVFYTPNNDDPTGITAGPDGNLWFSSPYGNGSQNVGIGSINPTTDAIAEYSIPNASSSPFGITAGPDGNIWFNDQGTNAIGVATLTNSQLVVTTEPPASITAGSSFGLTVEAEDSSGNLITSFNGTVAIALANNPGGGTLGGTLTATASGGVATFSGLTLTTAASGYSLVVSGGGYGEGMTSAVTVTPAAPAQLVITTEPPAIVKLNGAFGLQASIEDQYGNVVTTDTNTVTVAFANNPTGATLSGTLSVAASQGVATFSGLKINKTGNGYTLQVASSGLSSAVSSAIDVTKTGKAIVAAAVTAGTTAPVTLLAPLAFDSPGFLDSLKLKKHARTT